MKIFISQPMNGKTTEQIKNERQAMVEYFEGMEHEVIDSIYYDTEKEQPTNVPLWYLGKSLQDMSKADAVVFMHGWENARGCLAENHCAKTYGIETVYQNAQGQLFTEEQYTW